MSKWADQNMDDRIVRALAAVHINNPGGHHFGRPFLSSYQIAIALDHDDHELRTRLAKQLGGQGTGVSHSMAQYIGNQLSRRIRDAARRGDQSLYEGVFLSNENVLAFHFRGPVDAVVSSVSATSYDLGLFRLTPEGLARHRALA